MRPGPARARANPFASGQARPAGARPVRPVGPAHRIFGPRKRIKDTIYSTKGSLRGPSPPQVERFLEKMDNFVTGMRSVTNFVRFPNISFT